MRKAFLVALGLAAILCLDVWIHGPMAAALFGRAHLHAPHALEHAFWDAEPYAAGIADYRAGRSPYHADDLANPLPFAYPPVFVWAGAAGADILPSPWGWRLYLFVYLASVFGLQMLLDTLYLRKPHASEWLALLCLFPLTALLSTAFLSGNIHVIWYFGAALAAIPGLRRDRWLWFYLVTLAATINQPVFIAILLLPVLAGRKQYLAAGATAVAAALGYVADFALNPPLYREFQQTVANHLAASRDFGQGIFGIGMRLVGGLPLLPGAVQILFSLSVVALLVWLKFRGVEDSRRWWAIIGLGVILVNPRIMPYDAAQGFLPAIFFMTFGLKRGWLLVAPVVVACVAAHALVGFTPLIVAGFAAGAIQLWRETSTGSTQ